MPANWNNPTLSSAYADFLNLLAERDVDSLSLMETDGTNIPEKAIKYLRSGNKFQERISGAWVDKILSLAGGGTGAATATDARTNLGLGTIASQNANNVTITGGTISNMSSIGCNGALTVGGSATINVNLTVSGQINVGTHVFASGVVQAVGNMWTHDSLYTGPAALQLTHPSNGKIHAISSTYFQSMDGSGITGLNASALASGTLPDARFPATLPAIGGVNLTSLNASNLSTGTIPDARYGTPSFNAGNLSNLNASALAFGTVNVARLGSGAVGSGLRVLLDNNTWGFAGGMRDIFHGDISYGTNETGAKDSTITWEGGTPSAIDELSFYFFGPEEQELYSTNSFPVRVWCMGFQSTTVLRFYREPNTYGTGNINPSTHRFIAFWHRVEN